MRRTRGKGSRRRSTSRPRAKQPKQGLARPREKTISQRATARRRNSALNRNPRESGLQTQLPDGRYRMRPLPKRPADRLSKRVVSPHRRNEATRRAAATKRVCAAKKQERRAVIIATGYGGRNGFTDYNRRKSCP